VKAYWIERQQINQKDHPHHKRRKKPKAVKRFDKALQIINLTSIQVKFMKNSDRIKQNVFVKFQSYDKAVFIIFICIQGFLCSNWFQFLIKDTFH